MIQGEKVSRFSEQLQRLFAEAYAANGDRYLEILVKDIDCLAGGRVSGIIQ